MNTADKKVIIDAITEAAVCLAAIPDFMAGERITNALHQLQRAGAILEIKDHDEEFFEVGARYLTMLGGVLEFVKYDNEFDPLFKEIHSDLYRKDSNGLVGFSKPTALNFTKL